MSLFSDPTSLFIQEQSGERNKLELSGRALPYRPIAFEGGMRAEFTWYPGNPQATTQLLGSNEKSTSINGMWKDRFLSVSSLLGIGFAGGEAVALLNDVRVADVASLIRVVDEFRRRGQLLRFSWGPIIRQGIMTRFRHAWLRRGDVEWEMEFGWVAQRESLIPIQFGPSFNIADTVNAVNDAVQEVKDVIEAPFAIVDGIKGTTLTAVSTIEEAVAAINSVADKVTEAILTPFEAADIVLASVQTVKSQAKSIADSFESIPARALRVEADVRTAPARISGAVEDAENAAPPTTEEDPPTGGAGGISGAGGSEVAQSVRVAAAQAEAIAARSRGIDGITHEEALEAEKYKRDVRAAVRNLRTVSSDYEQQLIAQTSRVPDVKSYSVRANQDLRDVSSRFYGTQEEWKRLLLYNNLADSRLSAGQIVLIPPLSTLKGA